MKGIIVTWIESRAYGFVQPHGSSDSYFVHISNFTVGVPQLGAEIDFEIGAPVSLGKKQQAIHAKIVSIPTSGGLAALAAGRKDSTDGAL